MNPATPHRSLLSPRADPGDLLTAVLPAVSILVLGAIMPAASAPQMLLVALGVGGCGYLMSMATLDRHAVPAARLRAVISIFTVLAASGLVLRTFTGGGTTREWLIYGLGMLSFLVAAEIGARCGDRPNTAAMAVTLVVVLAGLTVPLWHGETACANGSGCVAPLPPITLGMAFLLAAGLATDMIRPVLADLAVAVTLPTVTVLASLRDRATVVLLGPVLFAVMLAGLASAPPAGRAARRRLLVLLAAVPAALVAGVEAMAALLRLLRVAAPAPPAYGPGLLGRGGPLPLPLEPFGRVLVVLLVAVLLWNVIHLCATVRRRRPGFPALLAAGVAAHLVVSFAVPCLAWAGLPAPPGLRTLPPAADGLSFLVAFAELGLLIGAATPPRTATGSVADRG
ncbi:hypothetical protein GCM10010112_62900 [Actinoplanes lobatus]|uniref:Uncharacterized protein n=1 Tax=Actinoplanes lobatus TaxID=113568 RepID=A0A7W7HKF1_9ACTN|nr:hypothetical protein [Actinoplanes lobatus]MBB4752165.1 hypothetical protein [Actinoplanes lobatus]GGN84009.1 hypothetical protein GCM10010112_62900 [Actinoplanes lobatus]GIE44068.1 hypothetical protein Alo02nite_69660 [Actinoplanes lobatus]